MKALSAKDIETLENTSVAGAALAATVGLDAEGFGVGCYGWSCEIDSHCHTVSCDVVTCAITSLPELPQEAPAGFVSLLRAALR